MLVEGMYNSLDFVQSVDETHNDYPMDYCSWFAYCT
jgi:hypothetical protein